MLKLKISLLVISVGLSALSFADGRHFQIINDMPAQKNVIKLSVYFAAEGCTGVHGGHDEVCRYGALGYGGQIYHKFSGGDHSRKVYVNYPNGVGYDPLQVEFTLGSNRTCKITGIDYTLYRKLTYTCGPYTGPK